MVGHANLVRDKSIWARADLKSDKSWHYRLTQRDLSDLESAVRAVNDRAVGEISKNNFTLSEFRRSLEFVHDYAENDRGVFLIRGLPVEDKSYEDLARMLVGIAAHFGPLLVQDVEGTLVLKIENTGLDYGDIAVVGGQTSANLTPHCDSGDLTLLCCVRPADRGGITYFVSSSTIFSEIVKEHPEYLDLLSKGFHYNIRDRGPPGSWSNVTRHRVPVFLNDGGKIRCRYNLKAILTAEEWGLTAPLSGAEREAVKFVAKIAERDDLRYGLKLKAGDLLILNTHATLHYRSSFTDRMSRRLLLRAWVNIPECRLLPDHFADHFNTGPHEGPYQRQMN